MVDFLTMSEVAEKIHVSKRWLQEFLRGQPIGRKAGRQRLFTEADLIEIYRRLPQCPSSSIRLDKAERKTIRYAAPTGVSELTAALARLTKGHPKSGSKSLSEKSKTGSNVVALPKPPARHSQAL